MELSTVVLLAPAYTPPQTLCQWCRSWPVAAPGTWCCELHEEADRKGQPHPHPYVPGSGGTGCVWCGQMPNDCDGRACRRRA